MSILAIGIDDPITWGEILVVLGVFLLISLLVAWFPRKRR